MLSANSAQNCGPQDTCPLRDRDKQLAVDAERRKVGATACEVLAQRDDRHEADHADEYDRALNDAKSDMADRDAPVDAPHMR